MAHIGQILQADNTQLKVSTKFYNAVVLFVLVLLHSSETWTLSTTALVWLEGFHIQAAYHWLRNTSHGRYQITCGYPSLRDMLKECGMHIISHYIESKGISFFGT